MRRIKLRYWNAIHQEFIQDCDVYHCPNGEILVGDLDNPPVIRTGDSVIPSQFTGLKDKCGAEIFEGDILTSEDYPYQDDDGYNYHGVIEYADEIAAFVIVKRIVNNTRRGISDGMADLMEDVERFEIIGNIYEHPHLLEEIE